MTNHTKSIRFLRQSIEFEKLSNILKTMTKTDRDKVMVQVAEGMAKVCEMLAEIAEKELEK